LDTARNVEEGSMRTHATMTELLQMIHGEFSEMPGLRLTKTQVRRLWDIDAATCDRVIDALVAADILRLTSGDVYSLSERTR
jgi:hypothetical protein